MSHNPKEVRISEIIPDTLHLEMVWRNGRAWVPMVSYEELYIRYRNLLNEITEPTQIYNHDDPPVDREEWCRRKSPETEPE